MFLVDLLYTFALLATWPFWIKYLFKPGYREILRHRISPAPAPGGKNPKRIWIHAVSVGEVKALKSLISRLREAYPELPPVLSVSTPSGYAVALKEYPHIPVLNAPLDFSPVIRKFIRHINPHILLLNELELWPNWITLIKKAGVPLVLINGRISDRAFRRYRRFRFILGHFFSKIDRVLAQSEMYRDRFIKLGIRGECVITAGNIKADEAARKLDEPWDRDEMLKLLKLSPEAAAGRKIVVIASSHAGDEMVLIPSIRRFSSRFLFIIVPRHVERAPEISRELDRAGVRHAVWSGSETTPAEAGALIFDRMGVLFQTMRLADLVFMGGAFNHAIGGHNLYEPAILGKPIVGGPYYNNFPCLGSELSRKGVYRTVHSAEELEEYFETSDQLPLSEIQENGRQVARGRQGSLEHTLDEIQRWLR